MSNVPASTQRRIHSECPRCERHTYHLVHYYKKEEYKRDKYWRNIERYFLQCMGCDEYNYRHDSVSSNSPIEEWSKKPKVETNIYPTPTRRKLKESIKDLWLTIDPIEETIYALFSEIADALQAKNYRLVAMGVRAIIETVMIATVGDKGTLTKNLQALEREGHISRRQRKILEDIVEIGSATIHRQFAPNEDEAKTAMDISESIVESVIIFPKRAQDLGSRVPKRKKRQDQSTTDPED